MLLTRCMRSRRPPAASSRTRRKLVTRTRVHCHCWRACELRLRCQLRGRSQTSLHRRCCYLTPAYHPLSAHLPSRRPLWRQSVRPGAEPPPWSYRSLWCELCPRPTAPQPSRAPGATTPPRPPRWPVARRPSTPSTCRACSERCSCPEEPRCRSRSRSATAQRPVAQRRHSSTTCSPRSSSAAPRSTRSSSAARPRPRPRSRWRCRRRRRHAGARAPAAAAAPAAARAHTVRAHAVRGHPSTRCAASCASGARGAPRPRRALGRAGRRRRGGMGRRRRGGMARRRTRSRCSRRASPRTWRSSSPRRAPRCARWPSAGWAASCSPATQAKRPRRPRCGRPVLTRRRRRRRRTRTRTRRARPPRASGRGPRC